MEKSQPEGKRIIRLPSGWDSLSVYPRGGISLSASETDGRLFFLPIIGSFLRVLLLFPYTLYDG